MQYFYAQYAEQSFPNSCATIVLLWWTVTFLFQFLQMRHHRAPLVDGERAYGNMPSGKSKALDGRVRRRWQRARGEQRGVYKFKRKTWKKWRRNHLRMRSWYRSTLYILGIMAFPHTFSPPTPILVPSSTLSPPPPIRIRVTHLYTYLLRISVVTVNHRVFQTGFRPVSCRMHSPCGHSVTVMSEAQSMSPCHCHVRCTVMPDAQKCRMHGVISDMHFS